MKLLLFCILSLGFTSVAHCQSFKDTAFNFSGVTPDNKSISLSDYRGKFVLLDFWASWCRPCRKLSGKLIKIYDEFHQKGLEIIGIANDISNEDKWKNAINDDGISIWPQILDQNIYPKYAVYSLPTLILIDPNGKIIEKFGGGYLARNKLKAYLSKTLIAL